jgi:predicted alpha/beta-fold hydrolase
MERMGKAGCAIAVMNGRGAGRSPIEAVEHAFHLGRSSDLLVSLDAVETMLKPKSVPIYIIGYSAGGIRALKFASVYGDTLKGRVSAILSFGASVRNTHTALMRSSTHVYQPVMTHAYAVTMLHKLLEGANGNGQEIESLFTARAFDTFRDFDTRVTSVLHNMTLEEYEKSVFAYHDDDWKKIAVPTLIVNAIDDPVLHIDDAIVPEMATMNSNICQLVTSKGGHIGWPTGFSARDHGYRWMSDVCFAFIRAISD